MDGERLIYERATHGPRDSIEGRSFPFSNWKFGEEKIKRKRTKGDWTKGARALGEHTVLLPRKRGRDYLHTKFFKSDLQNPLQLPRRRRSPGEMKNKSVTVAEKQH